MIAGMKLKKAIDDISNEAKAILDAISKAEDDKKRQMNVWLA